MSTDFLAKNLPFVGGRLQEERKALGFSNREMLGEKLDVSGKTVTNWESGASYPDVSGLLKLADLGFDVVYVLAGTRSPLVLEQPSAEYTTPARRAAAEIAAMSLSGEDAELILNVARRLDRAGSKGT